MAREMFFWVTSPCAETADDSAVAIARPTNVLSESHIGYASLCALSPARTYPSAGRLFQNHGTLSGYFFSFEPVVNTHQTVARHAARKRSVMPTLTLWLTSAISK